MEEIIKQYYPLGSETFTMMVFKRGFVCLVIFIVLVFAIFFLDWVPAQYGDIAINIIFGCIALLLVALMATFFIGWLEYIRYGIFVYEKDIKIKRGLFQVEEVGIPYRRIKDVKVERSLSDQMFGLSTIIITMLEAEGGVVDQKESQVVLSSLEKQIAQEIQDTVLKKSEVEQIDILGGHASG